MLYLMDDLGRRSGITVKALGHQWYWQYDYPDCTFDSYLKRGDYRLLDSENRLFFPVGHVVQILITAADVLHS